MHGEHMAQAPVQGARESRHCAQPHPVYVSSNSGMHACAVSRGSSLARFAAGWSPSVPSPNPAVRRRLPGVVGSQRSAGCTTGVTQRSGASHGCFSASSAVRRRSGLCRSRAVMKSRAEGDSTLLNGSAAKEARWLSVSVAELKGKHPETRT